MANEVIGIEVAVKLDQLRAQLATLGPGMEKEAAAMTAALGKQLKAQTAAAKTAAAAMTAAQSTSVKVIGQQAAEAGAKFDKLGAAMGPLGGVLARISPAAGAVASTIAGLTGTVNGFGASGLLASTALGPLLGILAPIAIGVGFVAAEMADSAARAKLATEAMEGLAVAMQAVDEITATTAAGHRAFSVTLGLVTKEEAAYNAASEKLVKTYKFQNELLRKAIDLRVEAGQEQGLLDDVSALRDQQDQLFSVTKAEMGRLNTEHEYAVAVAESDEFIRKRDKAAVEGAKAAAAAAEAAAEAAGDAAARATDGVLKDMARHDAHRQASAEKQLAAFRIQEEASQAARDQVIADAEQKITAETEWARVLGVVAEEQREKTQMYASTTGAVLGSVTGLYDELLQNRLAGIDTESAAGKKAAMEVWEQQKGLAIASATLQAIVAIAMAVASAPPPANIPAIVMNTVAGAASVAAAVAAPAPKFAAGGFPDERTITAHAGEAILSRQGRAAMGDDAIQAANAGRMDAGPAVSQIVYKHRAFDYFVSDHLQLDGSLARTIRRGDRVGQLRRGRG